MRASYSARASLISERWSSTHANSRVAVFISDAPISVSEYSTFGGTTVPGRTVPRGVNHRISLCQWAAGHQNDITPEASMVAPAA